MKATPVVIVVVVGLLAAYLGYSSGHRRAVRGWDLVPVVVAAQDIAVGQTLETDMIAQRPMPSQFVTPSIILPENYSHVVGQKVLVSLKKGDPILWSQFASDKDLLQLCKAVEGNAVPPARADAGAR